MEVINASHIINSLSCVVVVKIIFLMCCGNNKGLKPYKYKERRINGSLEPPAKAAFTMRMESPSLLDTLYGIESGSSWLQQ